MFKFKTVSTAWNFVQGIWLTFVAAVPMFVYVAYLTMTFRKAGYAPPFSPLAILPVIYLFAVLALVSLIGGVILYWKLPAVFFRKMARKIAGESERSSPEQSREIIIKAIYVLPIIIASFFMACAVYGFAPVMMGADFWRMLPFAGASLAALIIFWPRRGLRERIIGRIAGMSGIDVGAIDLGSEAPRRASRMKVIALSLIILWLPLQTGVHLFVYSVLGNSSNMTTAALLIALGGVLFWGLLAWRFQRFGGLCLIIFWSLMFVIMIITIIRGKGVPWPFLPINILLVTLPLVSGILYYLDYRRQAKESVIAPVTGG